MRVKNTPKRAQLTRVASVPNNKYRNQPKEIIDLTTPVRCLRNRKVPTRPEKKKEVVDLTYMDDVIDDSDNEEPIMVVNRQANGDVVIEIEGIAINMSALWIDSDASTV